VLEAPANGAGLVLWARGDGDERETITASRVRRLLHGARLATLVFDLLTPEERSGQTAVPPATRLAERWASAARAARDQLPAVCGHCGYFARDADVPAAFIAAARDARDVRAVVTWNGRPDLAGAALDDMFAPALMMAGDADPRILRAHREAMARLPAGGYLEVMSGTPGRSGGPEPDRMAELAAIWFRHHLLRPVRAAA
jgi:hypothetical protein